MATATTVLPVEAYRRLAATYDSIANPLLALERRILEPPLPVLAGRRVIDVGAGTGYWANHCGFHGAETIALDFCLEMLSLAQKPVVVADARRIPLPDECADVVVCAFAVG